MFPTLAYPVGAPLAAPAVPFVRVGSRLALLGWALREELIATSGATGACDFIDRDGVVCGATFRKQRARTDGVNKARTMCELHYKRRAKRQERAR